MSAAASRPISSPTAGLRLLEREEEVAAHLDPQRRPGRGVGAERLEVAEVLGRELVHERVLQPDERDAPVGRHDRAAPRLAAASARGSSCRARAAGAAPAWSCASADRASAESKNVASLVQRGHDHLGGQTGLACAGGGQQLARLLGVETRHLEGVLEPVPEGAGSAHDDDGQRPARSRSRPTGGGQPGGQDGTGTATSSVVLHDRWRQRDCHAVSVATRRGRAHRPQRRRLSRPIGTVRRLVLSADARPARGSLRWGRDQRRGQVSAGRAPSRRAPAAGLAGLGTGRCPGADRRARRHPP